MDCSKNSVEGDCQVGGERGSGEREMEKEKRGRN